MKTDFSAAPQALGYLYQIHKYSLYVALTNTDLIGGEGKTISIEKFDDIEVSESGSPIESLQVKRISTNLTNRSLDFWKTIRLWCESYKTGHITLPTTVLTLVTTSKAPIGSIASLLRPENRNIQEAVGLLRMETESYTTSLEKSFDAFRHLSHLEQEALVNSIYILDGAPDIFEIETEIKNMLLGVHVDNRDRVFQLLESWWLDQVVNHLRQGSELPIPIASIVSKIADINRSIDPPKLEDPFFAIERPTDYDWDGRTFVRQLRMIDLRPELVKNAIYDFYRASKLRNWLIEEVHLIELTAYDQALREEWEVRFFSLCGDIDYDKLEESELSEIGRKIYNAILREVDIPIHPDMTKRYVTRGSYQVLADNVNVLDIGWHPQFKERMINGVTG